MIVDGVVTSRLMVTITSDDLNDFVLHCQEVVPEFLIYDGKRSNYLMNVVDGIVYPFNSGFMDKYTTTIAGSVFFPEGVIKRYPLHALEVIGHEFVHAYDAKRLSFPLFASLYLSFISFFLVALVLYGSLGSPYALLPLGWAAVHAGAVKFSTGLRRFTGFPLLVASLITGVGLSFWDHGWGVLWLLGSMVLLAPLPAFGRTWAELRGYGASITLELELFGETDIAEKVKQFTGSAYYWMMPFPRWVAKKLKSYETKALRGDVTDPAISHILGFVKFLKQQQGIE